LKDSRAAVIGAFGYLTAVAILDAALRTRVILIGLLIIGPFVTARWASRRSTVAASIYSIALGIVLAFPDGIWGTIDHVVRVLVLVAGGLVAVAFATLREEREEALQRIAHVADVAQKAILRQPPPRLGPVAIAARYLSAAEEALIGGDLYETAYTPYGVRIIVGDVRGKGLDAVGLAASVLSCFRENMIRARTVGELAQLIDAHVASIVGLEEFVTAVLVELPEGGGVQIVNCGHHPPLRIGDDDTSFLMTGEADRPLGLNPACVEQSFPLVGGERLLLYTDGLVEARNDRGEEMSLAQAAALLREGSLEGAIDGLVARLLQHVGGRPADDMAVLLAERVENGAGAGAG